MPTRKSLWFNLFHPPKRYLTDDSLFHFVQTTKGKKLASLEVSDNGTVTDKGVAVLRKIETLRRLKLQNLAGKAVFGQPDNRLK